MKPVKRDEDKPLDLEKVDIHELLDRLDVCGKLRFDEASIVVMALRRGDIVKITKEVVLIIPA